MVRVLAEQGGVGVRMLATSPVDRRLAAIEQRQGNQRTGTIASRVPLHQITEPKRADAGQCLQVDVGVERGFVGQALRVMAEEGREQRMMEAEKKAASLPPKLTVPLILFFLPVLFIVIISPALITVFSIGIHF